MRVQMLGLCRFSYLGLRGFQKEHATIEERRAFLYDPRRLQRRWFWFRHVALPAWLDQTDPDFTLVIMTGPDLPQPYLDRLTDLATKVPQLRLELVPPMDRHLPACLRAVSPHLDPTADVIGHFRHDDDDAVAVDYIARARADFQDGLPIWHREQAVCIDHMQGLMVRCGPKGVNLQTRICFNMGVAQTIFLAPDVQKTALHFEHWKIGQWMPVVSISAPLMFLRLIHVDSDSGDAGPGFALDSSVTFEPSILRSRFGVDAVQLDHGVRRLG